MFLCHPADKPTNQRHGRKNKTSTAAKTEPNSVPRLLVSLNTNALHNTAFIHIGMIVISFQYFLVPVPLLTPIASHLPPPVSVCVSAVSLHVPQATAVGGERESLSIRSILQGSNTAHTWDLDVHTQTLAHTLKGLITKPRQSARDQDAGDDIKRPTRGEVIREEKMSIWSEKMNGKNRKNYCF